MKKVDSTNGEVEFQFSLDDSEGYKSISKAIYRNASDEYYLIESEEYNIGSAYDHVKTYYLLDEKEVESLKRMSMDVQRKRQEAEIERERNELENRRQLLTAGEDRDFYKKKKSDAIWWKKETNGEHCFSFDREVVFDLMKDYPNKLTQGQKEIFDRENPIWAKRLQKKDDH